MPNGTCPHVGNNHLHFLAVLGGLLQQLHQSGEVLAGAFHHSGHYTLAQEDGAVGAVVHPVAVLQLGTVAPQVPVGAHHRLSAPHAVAATVQPLACAHGPYFHGRHLVLVLSAMLQAHPVLALRHKPFGALAGLAERLSVQENLAVHASVRSVKSVD